MAKKCPISIKIAKSNKMELVNINTVLRDLVRGSFPQKGILLKGLVNLSSEQVDKLMCLS